MQDGKKGKEPERNVDASHTVAHTRKSTDGTAEIVGPMTVEAFKETDYYKGLGDGQKKQLEEHFTNLKDSIKDLRVVVQNKLEKTQEGEKTTTQRIHIGDVNGNQPDTGGFMERSEFVVARSINMANGKSSAPENKEVPGQLKLNLNSGDRPRSLPTNADVDKFIKDVGEREKTNELAAALDRGHSGKISFEGPVQTPAGKSKQPSIGLA